MALQSARRALFPHPPDPIQKDTESNTKMETAHTPSLCDSVDHDLESSSATTLTTLTTVEEKFLQPIHFEGLDLVPQGDVQNLLTHGIVPQRDVELRDAALPDVLEFEETESQDGDDDENEELSVATLSRQLADLRCEVASLRRRKSEFSVTSTAFSMQGSESSKTRMRARVFRKANKVDRFFSTEPPQKRISHRSNTNEDCDSVPSTVWCPDDGRRPSDDSAGPRLLGSSRRTSIHMFSAVNNVLADLRNVVEGEIMGAHPAVQELFESANTVRLEESVWDVALFTFYTPMGRATNYAVILPILLTMFLQVCFTCVVVLFIMDSEDAPSDLIDAFEAWRLTADSTVIADVCKSNASLTTSFRQQQTYDVYRTYTFNTLGEGYGLHCAGPFTCILVCCAWTLTVLEVLGKIMDKVLSIFHLTDFRSDVMELQVFQTVRSSGFKILTIPLHRAAWFLFICISEGVIGVLLLMAGIQWLVSTTEIVELLLNSVALAYIMDLDELIYAVFIPVKVCTMMRLLEPLPARWPIFVPVRSLFLACVGAPCVAVAVYLIDAQLQDSVVLRETLCPGGNAVS